MSEAVDGTIIANEGHAVDKEARPLEQRFGSLAETLVKDHALVHAWRLSFLANFFTGPFYRLLDEVHGISRPEFVILYGLSQRSGVLARDVSLATGLPKNSISRAVSILVRKKLIERKKRAEDRRGKELVMTREGARLLREMIPLATARQAAMRAVLDDDEKAEFDRLLRKIVYAMPDWVQPE